MIKMGAWLLQKNDSMCPIPPQLKTNILGRSWKLLHSAMPDYEIQIQKAVLRRDLVSINHRVTAFLEAYFDFLLALNEQTHPGEKRLISLCRELYNSAGLF